MERPLVSVVVNNYNYGRFLRDAIDSALAQTYAPLEVVVVDDGSTDESRDIIASYGNRILPVLRENGGQGSAFNSGFAACTGEYVLFLDADDALLPTAVERATALFEPGVAKVYWRLWEIDTSGWPLGGVIPRTPLPEGYLGNDVLSRGPIACIEAPTSGNAWSRSLLEKILPMPELEFRLNADCYLSTLAPLYGKVRTVPEPQARYRVHGGNGYVAMPVGGKSRRQLSMYLHRCDLISQHGRALGLEVDPELWKDGTAYFEYLERVSSVSRELAEVVPAGSQYLLVDDGLWGDERGVTDAVAGRVAIPFPERDGMYNGRPADDAAAINELDRLSSEHHPEFLIVLWLAFWWMDYYAEFASHLRERFPCVLENERLVVFDLRE